MGCISSKQDVCEANPHMYQVVNIDADGNTICAGNLTLTRAELTLHCPNNEQMRWPLSGLRRYGCEANVFSIEAGRHCQCAEGVYSFRCERAHQLFLTLQMYIQNPSFQAHLRPNGVGATGGGSLVQQQQQHQRGPAMPRRTAGMTAAHGGVSNGNGSNGGQHLMAGGGGGGDGFGGGVASAGMPLSDLVGGPYAEPVPLQQQHRGLLASPNPQLMPLRNLRHGSITGSPLSPDGLHTPGSVGPHSLHAITPTGEMANGFAGNLYQECSAATTSTMSWRSPGGMAGAAIAGADGVFESNNNQIHNKKLSLDIPPAEPAPSPSSTFSAGNPLLSPASISYYHNDFPSSANYANAAAALYEFHSQQHQQQPSTPLSSCSSERAYMNITIGEQTALLSPVPETPRSTLSFTLSPTAATTPTTPLTPPTMSTVTAPSLTTLTPSVTHPEPLSASAGTAPLLWADCTAATAHSMMLEHEQRLAAAAAATAAATASLEAGRLYENLDLPGVQQRRGQQHQLQQRRPSSAASGTLLAKPPTTPLCLTTEQLLASEPSSPSMLYIVLDLDQPTGTAAAAAGPGTASRPSLTSSDQPTVAFGHGLTQSTSTGDARKSSGPFAGGGMASSVSATSVLPPDSPKHAGTMDYAKIDFNKTLALSNSTTPSTELDSEESRRTRHSSTASAMVG